MTQSVKGIDESGLTIKSNWLYVQTGDFIDKDPHVWENKINIQQGGYDLLEFENLGIVSSNDDQIIYKCSVLFGFEITANTYVGINDAFASLDLSYENSQTYFAVINTGLFGIPLSTANYPVQWNSVEYSEFKNHDYHGFIPVTTGIKDITSKTGSILLNGEEFALPEYKADVIQVRVKDLKSGTVGDYQDIFVDNTAITEGSVDFVSFDEQLPTTNDLIDFYNDYNLGFSIGDVKKGATFQQLSASGSQVGATFDNVDPAYNEEFGFNLFSSLTPEAYEYVQYNTLRYAGIKYDTIFGVITPLVGPATYEKVRRVAVHSTNPYLHWDFVVDVEFYGTMESTAELTEAVLSDPYLERGDWVWDTSVVGVYDVTMILTNNLVEIIIALIFGIIVIVVIVAILLYIYFKRLRQSVPSVNVNIK